MSHMLINKCGDIFKNRCRALAVLAVCLGFLAWGGTARASGVEITIKSGFDGRCKLGGLNPVVVVIEAVGEGRKGVLKLKAGERTYSVPAELERGARKAIRFSIPFFGAEERIEAAFEGEGGDQVKAGHTPVILPERTIFFGVLSDSPKSLYFLNDLDTSGLGGGRAAVVELDRQIPYSLDELENINFIIVEDFRTGELAGSKARLLEDWVALGNCLLAGAGDSAHKNLTGLLAGLREPLRHGDGVMVPVAGGIAGSTPESLRDVVLKHVTPYSLAMAVKGSGLQRRAAGAAKMAGAAGGAVRPERSGLYLIFSLIILYVLAAGAAALAGKRLKWAFGAVVAFFCLFFLGLSLHGGIFKAVAGGAGVRVHGPVSRTYALTCVYPHRGDGARIKISCASFASAQGASPEADALSREVYCPGRTGHYIHSSSYEPGGAKCIVLTAGGDGVISGEIINPLPYDMENCFMIIGDTVIPVGKMGGRERLSVKYSQDHNLRGAGDYNYLDLLYRAAGVKDQRRHLIDYYFYHVDDYRPGGRLIGFARESAEVEINGAGRSFRRTVMNVFPIDIRAGDGSLSLPPEVVRPVADCGPAEEGGSWREYSGGPGGELKLYYVMPPGLEPAEIAITGSPGAGENSVSVYNRAAGRWEALGPEILAGERLRPYLSAGPLALSVRSGARVLIPQMAVKGVEHR
ncbi:MAG: hypothetical protein K6T66_02315 [Peptococcaceae bacterium]|nr:hypothetical protein [Peptococcaceae bacterium]